MSMDGTSAELSIERVKAGQVIDDEVLVYGNDNTVLRAYMVYDRYVFRLYGLEGMKPDDTKAAEALHIVNEVFRSWPKVVKAFVDESSHCLESGRSMWPEETDGPLDLMKTDGYAVYVRGSGGEIDLRWMVSAWPIRMDHESTRGVSPADFDSYMFAESLTNVYEVGSMLSELWLHMHDVYQNAREHDDVLSSDLLLDLS